MNENFRFFTLKMDSLAEKITAHDVYFSTQGVKDLYPDHGRRQGPFLGGAN